ncbi:transposase [Natronolimnohabitans sp. A-GB9]|uniref:transposase n=1 Tax=Natronolimnohabitans sp. A-GB9 TaxID=3069757 RepID=UPI0027B07E40|nr:transposase [Natronolimnohabitans sp. A-GB9]MDQ2049122.1 transposase [Natronolimnohabitans sp. A-GB9]
MQEAELTHSLSFGLDSTEGEPANLREASLEARRIRNEVNRLDRQGWDWDDIETPITERANHVKNTTQQLIDKALQEIETYHEHKDADRLDWGRPRTYIDEPYPVRMNHNEGYALTLNENGEVAFRISYKPYNYVRGTLQGSPDHRERVKTALTSDDWRVGTAELVYKHDEWRLHVTTTHETHTVASPETADTIVGIDINEDCIALAALTRNDGVIDSTVIEYPDIKRVRHGFFTKRKRMQEAGQSAMDAVVQTEERDFVHDQLHKVSRDVVEWLSQFENPVVVFEDLKDMREDIDYGTRMNRRLHSLPFNKLRNFISYKAAWNGIPSQIVDPEYTSQRCPCTDCLHKVRANRRKKRFKRTDCSFQDHADRKAAVCVVQEWLWDRDENVPSLNTLPKVKKVRRTVSGPGGGADPHGPVCGSGVHRRGKATQASVKGQVRGESKSVASAVQD